MNILLSVICVLIAWILLFSLVHHFPLRVINRNLVCPLRKSPARVGFVRDEVSWGTFALTDVSSCTLLPGHRITCDKQCLK